MDYIFYFILTVAVLVFIHELGHFLAAKICKMRVDVFALGFGKRLVGWNKINGFTVGNLPEDFNGEGNTDYRLSLIPLGGYVKISGMVDESMDTEFANSEPQPYEFRSKPAYQKLFVISAGVLMNLLLTLVIFWGVNFFQGRQIWTSTTVGVVSDTSRAYKAGFQSKDKILSINNKSTESWNDVLEYFLIDPGVEKYSVVVDRNGQKNKLDFDASIIKGMQIQNFFLKNAYYKVYISQVVKNSPAELAGVKAEDIFLEINDTLLANSDQAKKIISSSPEKSIKIKVLRAKDTTILNAKPDYNGKLGIAIGDYYDGPTEFKSYGFGESLLLGFTNIYDYTILTFKMIKNVVSGSVAMDQAFGGPVKIAQYAAKSADNGIVSFLMFLAMLSLSLAIINIMPFPALDGGHLILISIEAIIKREIPLKTKIIIQNTGFIVLLILMAFILYTDILSVF